MITIINHAIKEIYEMNSMSDVSLSVQNIDDF